MLKDSSIFYSYRKRFIIKPGRDLSLGSQSYMLERPLLILIFSTPGKDLGTRCVFQVCGCPRKWTMVWVLLALVLSFSGDYHGCWEQMTKGSDVGAERSVGDRAVVLPGGVEDFITVLSLELHSPALVQTIIVTLQLNFFIDSPNASISSSSSNGNLIWKIISMQSKA